jgi:hypothetical protein
MTADSDIPTNRQVNDSPEASAGLHQKYRVERIDGRDKPGGDKPGARYFVLDYAHDPLAHTALGFYAVLAREAGYEALADDLDAVRRVTPRPVVPR